MQSPLDAIAQENQNLNAHIARLAESDLVLVENEKLKKENQQVLAEKEKAQRIFAEAEKKAENANVVLMKAKALEADFNKHISVEAKHICKQVKADMQMQLQESCERKPLHLRMDMGNCFYQHCSNCLYLLSTGCSCHHT